MIKCNSLSTIIAFNFSKDWSSIIQYLTTLGFDIWFYEFIIYLILNFAKHVR